MHILESKNEVHVTIDRVEEGLETEVPRSTIRVSQRWF